MQRCELSRRDERNDVIARGPKKIDKIYITIGRQYQWRLSGDSADDLKVDVVVVDSE
jgi:hypothetical protein